MIGERGTMARDFGEFRLGSWVLTLDLLGTAVQMSEVDWFTSLNALLHTVDVSVHEALASGSDDVHLIQYGDSFTFCHDKAEKLICLGTEVQVKLFRQNILAQLGLSAGGAYYLNDTTMHRIVEGLSNIKLHCLVGPGVARSHMVLRGIRGPRFIIDEEIGHVPASGPCWEKLLLDPKLHGPLHCSELRWWKNFPGTLEMTEGRIKALQSKIESEKAGIKEFAYIESLVRREIDSLTKRLEHYECFHQVLEKDSEL
jgi:hypothetical protein